MVKRCAWGTCKTDSRYTERLAGGVFFVPFPKPKTNFEKCQLWIKLCGRPDSQLNISKITHNTYVCSKHFVEGKPTDRFPDPVEAKPSSRSPPRKRRTNNVEDTWAYAVESTEFIEKENFSLGGYIPIHDGEIEPRTDNDQSSQNVQLPIKIEMVDSDFSAYSGCSSGSSSPVPLDPATQFWKKCREAGCVESVFSTFISSVTSLSERILSEQANEEDYRVSFRVLEASGMLPEIFAQKEMDIEGKLQELQREREALESSRSAMRSASKMFTFK